MPKKPKPFEFYTVVDPYHWGVIIHTDEQVHRDFMAGKGFRIERDSDGYAGWAAQYGNGTAIYLRELSAGVLLHELVHAVTKCFHERGVPLSHDATEVLAYTLETLFVRCSSALQKEYGKKYSHV